jgi:tyrosyl-tRNA synthetase
MNVFTELKQRGLIAQTSHEKEIEALLTGEPIKFYIGFDATATSLHIGSLVQLMIMRRLQKAGHIPIVMLGTGTTVIGDPSGRTDMRKMQTNEDIRHNAELFAEQVKRFIDFSDGKAEVAYNGDWLLKLNYMEFLREIGVHFSVNRMLAAECYKSRMEKGLTYFEFSYMLLQSYDFLHLYRTQGVKLQLGGDDQWSNILAGADLIRRIEGANDAFAMTSGLLLNAEGNKMGKTAKGAVWLDAERTTPYELYQYLRNIGDGDVFNCLNMLTEVPVEQIEQMRRELTGAELNQAKELLAFEVTQLVHGTAEAEKAQNAARSVFGADGESTDMPTVNVGEEQIGIADLLVKTKQATSKRDARTSIEQGAVSIGGEKITDANAVITIGDGVVVKKGKKSFVKAVV